MAQPNRSPWIWDPRQQQYYRYDTQHELFVYQDGRPVPWTTPRGSSNVQQLPVSQPDIPPTQPSGHYTYRPPSQNRSPPLNPQPQPQLSATRVPASPPTLPGHGRHDSHINTGLLEVAVGGLNLATPGSLPAQAQPQPYDPTPVQGHVFEADGVRMVRAVDQRNGVQTIMGTEPPERITDPKLLESGVHAHRKLYGNAAQPVEQLFSTFRIRERPQRFFVVGRVFLVLWTEPAGETKTLITSREQNDRAARPDPGLTVGRFGERVYSKVRRFVVVRAGENYCSALPIASYGKQGVGKFGVKKSEHAIIYTGGQAPEAQEGEAPGRAEQPMRVRPIRVVPDEPAEKLDAMSRIDFGKVHTIQHNIKVKPFGFVHQHSMDALLTQFGNVWGHTPAVEASSSRSLTDAEGSSDDEKEEPQPIHLSARALEIQAQQARQVQSSYTRLVQQGRTKEQAFEILIQQLMAGNPNYSRESADALLRARLAHGSQARPQNTSGARQSDSEEGSDDNDSSDEEEATEGAEDAEDDEDDEDDENDEDDEDDTAG